MKAGNGEHMLKNVGVVGCGTMGEGIAQVCAQSGYTVKIYDIDSQRLPRCLTNITNALLQRVDKQKIAQKEMDDTLSRLTLTENLRDLEDSDIVIEAVAEIMEVKQGMLKDIEAICSEQTILATNTSSLSIISIAKELQSPSRLIGIHFFNPATAMKLVEIVKSIVVDDAIVEKATEFVKSLKKEIVYTKDTPGFLVNYLQYPFRLNAIRMLEQGRATVEEIDKAATLGLGHPMGPLRLQDLVGLDITYNAVLAIYEETKDPFMAPPVLMKRMVEAGLLGKKTKKGFYDYND